MALRLLKWFCPFCGSCNQSEIGRRQMFRVGDELDLMCDQCAQTSCFEVHDTGIQFRHRVGAAEEDQ